MNKILNFFVVYSYLYDKSKFFVIVKMFGLGIFFSYLEKKLTHESKLKPFKRKLKPCIC